MPCDHGVAVFTNLSHNVATTITIDFNGGGFATVTSDPIVVGPAAAASFAVSGYASPTIAGVSHSFSVTARDAFSNTATGYVGTVHFTSSDPSTTLPGDYTFVAGDAGVASASATLRTVGSRSITATAGAVTGS